MSSPEWLEPRQWSEISAHCRSVPPSVRPSGCRAWASRKTSKAEWRPPSSGRRRGERDDPYRGRYPRLRDGVEPAGVEGMAAHDPAGAEPSPTKHTVASDGFQSIL